MKMVILVRLIFRWNSKAQHLSDPIIITKCNDQAEFSNYLDLVVAVNYFPIAELNSKQS